MTAASAEACTAAALAWPVLFRSPCCELLQSPNQLGEARALRADAVRFSTCGRFQKLARKELEDREFATFHYPKVFELRRYAIAIRELGSAAIVDASYGEATHKIFKELWENTNKHGDVRGQVELCLAS